jgi:hypothetical protein
METKWATSRLQMLCFSRNMEYNIDSHGRKHLHTHTYSLLKIGVGEIQDCLSHICWLIMAFYKTALKQKILRYIHAILLIKFYPKNTIALAVDHN